MFVAAGVSQARVHLWGSGDILAKAKQTRRFVVSRTEFARRGTIYSSDGRVLAQSDDCFELGLEYRRIPSSPGFFLELGEAAGIASTELSEPAGAGVKSRTWRRPITGSQAKDIQNVKVRWRADGVSLRRVLQREYPLREAASALIGAIREGKPIGGLERSRNDVLSGTDGFTQGMVDRSGSFLPMRLGSGTAPQEDGQPMTLTIDTRLQSAAVSQVKHAVETNKADRGVAIAIDPRTGDVQAMACWPTFDPGGRKLSADDTDFNPAVMGAYEPGSTFKILTLAKALDKGVVDGAFAKYCSGELKLNRHWRVRCDLHHGTRAHGQVDLEKAIAKSCNVCAATWALNVGYADMVAFLEDLGLLSKTGVGLPGERAGMFNRNEYAKPLQIANVGFGQSLTATPLALASAFAAIANGGIRAEPRLVKAVGRTPVKLAEGRRVFSATTATTVRQLMEAVIETDAGTGSKLRIPGYRLSGKTGTAQKVNVQTGRVGGGGYVSSFVGFVPSEQPKSVILVMIDNPKAGQYYGASVAGPVFAEMARTVIRINDIQPQTAAKR
ncbi:MAG: putative peptidoglycan D,D-transpeptidase PenA [Fimbriimonadaceae bacterium]|nr:putative peptidoglycan D,D-transpeptidase PenA [Fimbriimonadaceae bacterium]